MYGSKDTRKKIEKKVTESKKQAEAKAEKDKIIK
jgi:hypothetical protein